MTNKRTATFKAEALAVFLLFVSSGDAGLSGFAVSDSPVFDKSPEINYLQDPTSRELKKKIVSAIKSLSIDGKQSSLVQYWAAIKAGSSHLLATTDQPFGIYGTDTGLELYRKACLHHKLYVHREGKTSFGLPGHTFEDRTPHQTQHMHEYPEEHRPPCADKDVFSRKWGSFTVPVILANECVGVLEIVDTEPTHTYDGDINEVNKALKCTGFESFNTLDTRKETHITNKRRRKTKSSKYGRYDILVPYFGLSKGKAMEIVDRKFFPKKQKDTTCEALHVPEDSTRKAKNEYKVIESTFTNALRSIGITEWPFIRITNNKASCAPKTRINPTVSGASSLGSLKADDLTSCLVKVEASEGSLERITTINTSELDTEIIQTVSYETNTTEAFFESAGARADFMPEGDKLECLGNETTIIEDLTDDMFSFACLFGNEGGYELLGTRFNQNETSSSGILTDAGDYNSGWQSITTSNASVSGIHQSPFADFEGSVERTTITTSAPETEISQIESCVFPDQEIHHLSETQTDQTLHDGTSSLGIDVGDFNSSWDKGVYERPFEPITTANTSGIYQSPIAGFEQESCEMWDGFFLQDLFKDLSN